MILSALKSALQAGDAAATLGVLRAMPAADRERQRDAVMAFAKHPPAQRQALDTAIILCGTARDVVNAGVVDKVLLIALCREFRPRSADWTALVEAMREHETWAREMWLLVRTGLLLPTDDEGHVLRLIGLPHAVLRRDKLDELFAADPGLRPSLLRVFEIEGTAETSLASSDKYCKDPKLAWGPLLLSLVDDGIATRAQLLDLTLGALEKDWPQYRASWFSRFHGDLAPTSGEMQPHLSRYLALCASRIPPTVTMALEALKVLDGAVPLAGDSLLAALAPVMMATVKAQVDAALKLLDGVVKREPALARRAAETLVPALLHEATPVQAGVLKRLEAWGLTPQARERLPAFVATVAAIHQPRLQKLLGEMAVAASEPAPAPAAAAARQARPLDEDRRLPALADAQELVECIAHVFEHADDVDTFERAVLGLALAAPLTGEDRKRFAPVAKRALKMRKPLPAELARLLCFAVDGTRLPRHTDPELGNPLALAALGERIDAVAALIAAGQGLAPLSCATHRGGFIAPQALAERIAAHAAAGVKVAEIEQVQALLRLAPGTTSPSIAAALPDTPLVRAFRYALGDDIEPGPEVTLFAAAARIRHPRADDPALDRRHPGLGPDGARVATYAWHTSPRTWEVDGKTYTHHDFHISSPPAPRDTPLTHLAVARHVPEGWPEDSWRGWAFGGREAGLLRYAASTLPSDLEAWCAQGAWAFGNNLDWWEAEWHNRAYLDVLLDAAMPLTPMPRLLLMLALCGKEAGQVATAVDLLVQAHAQGRLAGGPELDGLTRALFVTPLPKAARLHKSLQAALRIDPQVHGLAFALLCAVVQARPDDPPRDIGLVLDLLLELKTRHGLALPSDARSALSDMKTSGNTRKLQASLLA
ncbi:DUF6493 family protein [Roseateles sp. DXS20W]|uniref:DUF6493 family protein n=1 Tax=Pelomonas lactea TaxID=3299030 RepID=A0ABW7GPP4_9BURK